MDAKPLSGNTLILVHQTIHNPKISDKKLLDDAMIEVDWDGKYPMEMVHQRAF